MRYTTNPQLIWWPKVLWAFTQGYYILKDRWNRNSNADHKTRSCIFVFGNAKFALKKCIAPIARMGSTRANSRKNYNRKTGGDEISFGAYNKACFPGLCLCDCSRKTIIATIPQFLWMMYHRCNAITSGSTRTDTAATRPDKVFITPMILLIACGYVLGKLWKWRWAVWGRVGLGNDDGFYFLAHRFEKPV